MHPYLDSSPCLDHILRYLFWIADWRRAPSLRIGAGSATLFAGGVDAVGAWARAIVSGNAVVDDLLSSFGIGCQRIASRQAKSDAERNKRLK
jgi:hypothetical protein